MLVIGAGVIGVSTAYFLRRNGIDVTVVESSRGPGQETSFANAGLLTSSLADPWNAPGIWRHLVKWIGKEDAPILIRPSALPSLIGWGIQFLRSSSDESFINSFRKNVALSKYNLDVLHELQETAELRFDHTAHGTLRIFRDGEALEEAAGTAARYREAVGLHAKRLDRQGLLEIEPALAPIAAELVGAIHYPDDECGDARRYCEQLAGLAASEGVRFRFNTKVRALNRRRKQIVAAEVHDGTALDADVFVIAAGSHSAALVAKLGLKLPIRPAKGYSISVPMADTVTRPTVPVIDDCLHAAIVPLGGRLRVAGTAELAGFDLSIRPGRIENLSRLLRAVYPSLGTAGDSTSVQPWAGLRPMSADGVPILGETPIANLVLNTGHGHLGWSMAAASGKLIADSLAGRQLQIPLQNYGLQRFG